MIMEKVDAMEAQIQQLHAVNPYNIEPKMFPNQNLVALRTRLHPSRSVELPIFLKSMSL